MKNIIWIIGILAVILIFTSMEPKEVRKLAGETSSRSFEHSSIYNNQVTTVSVAVNPGTSTYLVIDEVIPTGWTVTSASDGGDYTTTPGHIFWVVLSGVTVKTYTYTINPYNNLGIQTFTGTIGFEDKPEGAIEGSTSVSVVACTVSSETCDGVDEDCNYIIDNGVTEACGSGNCAGTRTCTPSSCPNAATCQAGIASIWGNCNTYGNDCGTCCDCSTTGIRTYDSTQDGDCSATTCPSDDCGVDLCGTHIFGNYPPMVSNDCSSLDSCTSNTCDGTAVCTSDTDGDGYAGISITFADCYDCNNNDQFIYYGYPLGEVCGDGKDNDCSGISESYFNDADWGSPGGFCDTSGANDCCDEDITMNELLDGIGQWKGGVFDMNDLLDAIGAWKV